MPPRLPFARVQGAFRARLLAARPALQLLGALRLLGEVAPACADEHVLPQGEVGDLDPSLRDPDQRSVAAIRGQPFRPTDRRGRVAPTRAVFPLPLRPEMPNDLRRRARGGEAPPALALQTPKLPPASRNSTTGLPLSVPRTSTKIATVPLPETTSVPVLVVSRSVPFVTSTRRPNGTGPPVNGLPFNSTLPVGVPRTEPPGGAGGRAGRMRRSSRAGSHRHSRSCRRRRAFRRRSRAR